MQQTKKVISIISKMYKTKITLKQPLAVLVLSVHKAGVFKKLFSKISFKYLNHVHDALRINILIWPLTKFLVYLSIKKES